MPYISSSLSLVLFFDPSKGFGLLIFLPFHCLLLPIPLFLSLCRLMSMPIIRSHAYSLKYFEPSLISLFSLVKTLIPIKTNFLSTLHLKLNKCIYSGKNIATWVRNMTINKSLMPRNLLFSWPFIGLYSRWLFYTFCKPCDIPWRCATQISCQE